MSYNNYDYYDLNFNERKEYSCFINLNAQWWNNNVPSSRNVIKKLLNINYNCSVYKLFTRDLEVLGNIKLFNKKAIVAFNNWELIKIISNYNWGENEILKLIDYKDTIECVAVGNEPLGVWYNNEFTHLLVNATKIISHIIKINMPNVQITVPFNFAIFDNTYPPSNSVIIKPLRNVVIETLNVIKNHSKNSPVMVNIYPYLTYKQNTDLIDINFALGKNSPFFIRDGEYLYKSLFSIMFDAALVAIKKEGFDMDLVIGEVGWPDKEGIGANTENHCNALEQLKIEQTTGTPRQPGPLQLYLFEAIDEPWKEIGPGLTERHWGILTLDLSYKCDSSIILSSSKYSQNNSLLWLLLLIPGLLIIVLPMIFKKKKKIYKRVSFNNYMSIPNTVQVNL